MLEATRDAVSNSSFSQKNIFLFRVPRQNDFGKMASKCVHKGCGKQFTDPEEPCVYHPGPPVFHEGQKGKLKRTLLSHLAFYQASHFLEWQIR